MSYSFNVRAATKAEAKTAVAAVFDKVVADQPTHEHDKAAVLANANAAIDLLADNDEMDVEVSCSGWLSWISHQDDPLPINAANINCAASLVARA